MKSSGKIILTIVLGAVAFSGCGLKVGERPSPNTTVKLGDPTCLNGAARTLADYLNGKASGNQFAGVMDCASKSLKLFNDRVEGETNPGVSYTPNELRNFLEQYFLRDFTISDSLLAEFMELKKTLLGGTTDQLTKKELERLRNLLATLRDVGVRIQPYLPLTPGHTSELSEEDLDNTVKALREAAESVGQLLEEQASPYQFSHLDRLLSEVEKFLQDDDSIHDTAEIRKYLPLFISLKKIVVSPDPVQMAGKDWKVLLTRSAEMYGNMLRLYRILNKEPSLISGSGRVHLMEVSENVYKLLREVISSNPDNGTVSFCNLFSVIDEASKLFGYQHDLESLKKTGFQELPPHLRVYFQNKSTLDDEDYLWYFKSGNARIYRGTIKQFMLPLIQKYLKPPVSGSRAIWGLEPELIDPWHACQSAGRPDYLTMGLRPENLDRLWNMITRISEGQTFLEKAFYFAQENYGGSGNPLQTEMLPASLTGWLRPYGWQSENEFQRSLELFYKVPHGALAPETQGPARVMSQLIQIHMPFFRDNDARITFGNASPVADGQIGRGLHSYVGLSALNAVWQLVHSVWDAYVTDPARIEGDGDLKDGRTGGISIDELKQFYLDVKELGIAFKLFDPTTNTASDSRFLEGNLFTYASNGDQYLSLAEGTDLVAMLFSAKGLSGKTYNLVHDTCAKLSDGCSADSMRDGKSCNIGGKDVFGMDTIKTSCFRRFAMGEYSQHLWDHMPNLSKFHSALPELGNAAPETDRIYRETFSCLVLTVARPKGSSPDWIGSGDVDQVSALEHYLEAMFVRFDRDHSGTLNRDETLAAFPVLKKIISEEVRKRVSFLNSDEDFQAVLTYILARGKIPSKDDWKSILDFGIWRYIHESNYEADRARIVQVMAVILGTDVSGCFKNPSVLPESRRIPSVSLQSIASPR